MRFGPAALGVCLLALAAPAPAHAQRMVAGMSYDWSTPMGDSKKYVDNDSWLGFTLDVRRYADREARTSMGATFGYYEFYHMDPFASTINFGAAALTGQQYRHAFALPMMLNFTGYFGDQYKARPFIGLNAGATYVKQTVDVGIYTLTSDAFVVSAMPEIGVVFPIRGRSLANFHVRYHVPFGSDNLFSEGSSGLSFQYLSVGIGFMGRP